MAIKAKIFGAGSIGNHLANACRQVGWEVSMVDADSEALERTKNDIYPKRYGQWDESIKLYTLSDMPVDGFDVILIGTPPDKHLSVAMEVLKKEAPKVLQIEKPLCSPTLEGLADFIAEAKKHPQTAIVVGYDHILAENTSKTEEILKQGIFNDLRSLDCEFRSHWANIFKAHSWLVGPQDTYLGFWRRGGGAGGEHSHGINLWQHLAHFAGFGRVKEVCATFKYVQKDGADYDESCFINLTTEKGLVGRLAQDVITFSKRKFATMQFSNGYLEWHNDVTKTTDQVIVHKNGEEKQVIEISKTRPEEFIREIKHLEKILNGEISINDSPVRLERGVETMLVLAAAHRSFREKRTVEVDYSILD